MKVTKVLKNIIIFFILITLSSSFILPSISIGVSVTQELKSGINSFPKEYRTKLNELHKLHPNWKFEAYYTGIQWDELIRNESSDVMHKRNVVPSTSPADWKCTQCTNERGWTCASKSIIEYYIDPRNFLNEINIFQFEELSYNKETHTIDSLKQALRNTFLENDVTYYDDEKNTNITTSYAEIIMAAAEKANISPFQIKAKIIQEVGTKGSASVSGTYPGYENYYNFFNYGAHDTGDPIANGLKFAKEKGWNNQYKAIIGGAELIGSSYINAGQNTPYFFKFDVVGNKILKAGETQKDISDSYFYWHQYMTNLLDPNSQSKSIYNMYAQSGNLDDALNFIIPVYENMPGAELEDELVELTKIDDEEKVIWAIPDATIQDILSSLDLKNYELKNIEDELISKEDEKIATGYKLNALKSDNKTIEKTYTLIKIGDVNGDGKVSSADYVLIKNNIMEDKKLTEHGTKAADINHDSKISSADYVLIKNYIMENKAINIE